MSTLSGVQKTNAFFTQTFSRKWEEYTRIENNKNWATEVLLCFSVEKLGKQVVSSAKLRGRYAMGPDRTGHFVSKLRCARPEISGTSKL